MHPKWKTSTAESRATSSGRHETCVCNIPTQKHETQHTGPPEKTITRSSGSLWAPPAHLGVSKSLRLSELLLLLLLFLLLLLLLLLSFSLLLLLTVGTGSSPYDWDTILPSVTVRWLARMTASNSCHESVNFC